jgi:hypothetical protein
MTLHGFFPEAIVDDKTDSVVYFNDSPTTIRISKNQRIGTITEWDINTCATPGPSDSADVLFAFSHLVIATDV